MFINYGNNFQKKSKYTQISTDPSLFKVKVACYRTH